MLKIIYSTYIYLRTLIFLLLASIPAIIIIIIAPSKAHRVGSFLAKCLFKCFGIRFQIYGSFPTDGPYVIMHNHSSFLDMFFLPIVIKGKYTGVVAAKNFRIPIIGQIIQSNDDRLKALKDFVPIASPRNWQLSIAGQRVQIIKKTAQGGVLKLGTEVVTSSDGSLVASCSSETILDSSLSAFA